MCTTGRVCVIAYATSGDGPRGPRRVPTVCMCESVRGVGNGLVPVPVPVHRPVTPLRTVSNFSVPGIPFCGSLVAIAAAACPGGMSGRARKDAAALEKFHASFVEYHSSPAREKFLYEFGAAAAASVNMSPPPKKSAKIQLSAGAYKGPKLETSNQFGFRSYSDSPACFLPETKHRNLKAPTHAALRRTSHALLPRERS